MSIILKQEPANSVPTPPFGKGTLFLDENNSFVVKNDDGDFIYFPTVNGANTQVLFNDDGSLAGDANFTYDSVTGTLTVTNGNVVATGVKTDNLYYANGQPWDLQQPAGSNNQIQFNNDGSFGASANLSYDDSTQLLTVSGNIDAVNVDAGNLLTANFVSGTLTTSSQPNITSVGSLVNLDVSGNAVIGGNLTVNGNVTYVNVETLDIEDPIIQLQTGPNGAAPTSNSGKDIGTALNYYDTQARVAFMGWDVSNVEFGLASQASISGEVVTFTEYGNLRAGNIAGSNLVSANYVSGTLTTAAQPNITSVGALTSLVVSGSANSTITVIDSGNVGNIIGLVHLNPVVENYTSLGVNVDGVSVFIANSNTGNTNSAKSYWNFTSGGNLEHILGGVGAIVAKQGVFGTGNVTAGNVYANSGVVGAQTLKGEGGNISNIQGANVSGTVSSATTAGTVTTNAQPNITSVGTLSSLSVTGNANVGNIGATNGVFTNVSGNGAQLTAISGANVTGAVTYATTANSVAGANVSGAVAYATTANSVAGANVSGQVANALVAGTVYTAAQPNITSVGTLTSLNVSGNANVGNIGATNGVFSGGVSAGWLQNGNSNITVNASSNVIINAVGGERVRVTSSGANITGTLNVSGNANVGNIGATQGVFTNVSGNGSSLSSITGANVTGEVAYAATANSVAGANVSGQVSNALVAGTVYTAAQPNITSVGTLSSLGVSGDISGANITANTKIITDAINNKSGNLVVTSNANILLSTTGIIDAGSSRITSVATPTSDADAATKAYVDNLVSSGIHYHQPVRVESPTALNATYNNGTSGVGATLTNAGANAALVIDGISLNVADRVLVYTQANAVQNGVYVVTVVGNASTAWVLTRSSDTNTYAPSTDNGLDEGSYFFVQEGVTGAGESYVCSTVGIITFGTTPINFAQFSKAPIYTAGTGLTLSSEQFSISNTTVTAGSYGNGDRVATFTVNSQGQLTAAADAVITANAGNLSGTTLKSTVVNSSLTSVGTLGTLSVSGNADVGNISANTAVITTSNITTINSGLLRNGNSNITINANGIITISATGTPNEFTITSTGVNARGYMNVSGNVISYAFTARGPVEANLSSAAISSANAGIRGAANTYFETDALANSTMGNVVIHALDIPTIDAFNANVTATNAATFYIAGAPITAGTFNITNPYALHVASGNSLFSGNVTVGNIIGNGQALASITGANVTGQVANSLVSGTVYTAAQPNITSVGTLTSLGVNGTITGVNITANTGVFTGNGSALTALNASNISTGTIAQARLANSSLTVNGTSISLGGSATITANTTQTLTLGSYLTGTSFNGGTAVTATVDATTTSTASKVVARDANANIYANNAIFTAVSGNGSGLSAIVGANVVGNVSGAVVAGTVTTAAQGNITSVGTLTSLSVSGALTTTNITTGANTTAGSMTGNWTLTAGSRFQATYADLAERYQADSNYEPGTVVVLGGEYEVTVDTIADSHKVAGVVTTNPAYVMNGGLEGDNVVEVALIGRVPCKVVGPVSKGDLLTTSNIAGYAHVNNDAASGRIIGKALENIDGETGTIEIMVGRT